jgi:clan AA aspartic protease
MGCFEVSLRIENPEAPGRTATAQLLVDTGATITALPREILSALGIRPGMTRSFLLADGRRVQRQTGSVLATMHGVTMQIPVMFADPGDSPVLGASALEILGLAVDPIEKKLIPRDYLALGGQTRS